MELGDTSPVPGFPFEDSRSRGLGRDTSPFPGFPVEDSRVFVDLVETSPFPGFPAEDSRPHGTGRHKPGSWVPC